MIVCDKCGKPAEKACGDLALYFEPNNDSFTPPVVSGRFCAECREDIKFIIQYEMNYRNNFDHPNAFSSSKNRPIRIGIIRGKGPVLKWKIGMTKKQVVAAKRRLYYQKHKAEILAYQKKWISKHKKQWKEYQRKYAKKRWAEKHQ